MVDTERVVARQVMSLFADSPVPARARAMWEWSARPFRALTELVPPEGSVLDASAGTGVLACALALDRRSREVVGVNTDALSVAVANRAARQVHARGGRCRFELSPPGEIPHGPWHAIVLVEAIGSSEVLIGRGLLETCTEALATGGVVVVADRPGPTGVAAVLESLGLSVTVSWARSPLGQRYAVIAGRRPGLRAVN